MALGNAHGSYYHTLKEDSVSELSELVGEEPAKTCREARRQVAKAYRFGDEDEFIQALEFLIDIRHAQHELKEHQHDGLVGNK